jgi:MFS family permease
MAQQAKQARAAILGVFFINGFTLASWVPHIPLIQKRMELGEGLLGIALLAVALGAVILMPLAGKWCARFGSGRVTAVSSALFCAALPLPILSPNFAMLLPALFLFGACNGAMDVAMNAHAVAVEKQYGKPIMSSFHGVFSLGGLSGAALGGLLLSHGLSPVTHVLVVGGLMLIAARLAPRFFLPQEEQVERKPSKFVFPSGSLRALGALAFLILLAEGAVMDWSSIYMMKEVHVGVGLAAAGYAAFSLMMAAGRFAGDRLVVRLGSVVLTRATASLAAIGLVIALLIPRPLFAVVGFGCVGLGLSNLIPVLFSVAGRAPNLAPGSGN